MSYIGKIPTVGNFQVCDAISVVNNQAAYTMQVGGVNVSPESANHMIVSLNGVIQKPTDAFTVSGSTITFASNLVTNDVINFIQILGNVLDLGVPSDNTVTLAKLASGIDGNLISYDTSGNPVAIATGNDGQVLTSAGAGAVPTFETLPSSGAMTLISTNTLSSAVDSVTVSGMDSTYKNYKIIVSGLIPSQDNITLFARSITGGSINTDNYHKTEFTYHETGAANSGSSIDTDSWKIIGTNANVIGKNSGEHTNIEMTIFDPSSTALRNLISCVATFQSDNLKPGFTDSSIFYSSTDALQGVNFIASSGQIDAGTFKLYGIS